MMHMQRLADTTQISDIAFRIIGITAGLILGLCLAKERRCYFVTTSLIG